MTGKGELWHTKEEEISNVLLNHDWSNRWLPRQRLPRETYDFHENGNHARICHDK